MQDIEIIGTLTARELKLLSDHVDNVRVAVKFRAKNLTPADRLAIKVIEAYNLAVKEADAQDQQPD